MEGIVGREQEQASIGDAWDRAREGPVCVLITGEAGIGKSTVWSQGLAMAREAGFSPLHARPAEAERELSYAGLRDLLAGSDLPSELPGPQRRALSIAIRDVDATGAPPDRLAVCAAFTASIRGATHRRPLVLAIDDTQWMDGASTRVISYALRRIDAPLAVMLATRGPYTADPYEVSRAFADDLVRIHLAPLTMSELFLVLRARTGVAFARPVLANIERISGGNPFYALEIARAVVSSDGGRPAEGDLPIPDSLSTLVAARLDALPTETLDVLAAAALATDPSLAALRSIVPGDVRLAVAPATSVGVARWDDGSLVFGHPLYAAGVVSGLDAAGRRALHERLGRAEPDLEARARHLAHAADHPDPVIAAIAEQAGLDARDRGAPDAAVELLTQSVRLTPSDDVADRHGRQLSLAGVRFMSGDVAGTVDLLTTLRSELGAGEQRAEAIRLLAKVRFEQRSAPEAVALFEQAARDATGRPELMARIYADATHACDFDMVRRAGFADAAKRLLESMPTPSPTLEADVLSAWALAELCSGRGLRDDLLRRAVDLEAADLAPIVSMRASVTLGTLLMVCDRPEDARPLIVEAVSACRDADESSLGETLETLARLEMIAGDWASARTALRESLLLAERDGQPNRVLEALFILGPLQAATGDEEAAAASALRAGDIARQLGSPFHQVIADIVAGSVAWHVGDVSAAADRLGSADREDEREHLGEPGFRKYLGDLISALIALDRIEEARDAYRRLDAMGRSIDRASIMALAARGHAELAAAGGDLDEALVACERARALHDEMLEPYQLGRTLLVEGQVRRRSKQKRAALDTLDEAGAIFDRLGARPWADRVGAERDRIGSRTDRPDELTETERRVAELVAQGVSNREVAAALFVSVRTVEANLTRIYRKLGVPSRAGLGRKLAELDGP